MASNNMSTQEKEQYMALEQARIDKTTGGYIPQQITYVNVPQPDHEQALFPFMYGHDKWPHKVEKAFTTSLRLIMKSGTSKIKVRNKNYGRNELISLYIRYETGEVRTKKQISSHIQVWKKSILNKSSSNMRLTTLDREILNLIERGAEQTEDSLKRFYSTFETIIDALSKETVINPYHAGPTFIDPNRNVTNIYPQQYNREIAYGNFKSIVPTNNEMMANNQVRYAYPMNTTPYMGQPPNVVPVQYFPGYAPMEGYPVQQYEIPYAANSKPPYVNYPRPVQEYYKSTGVVADPHYMPQAAEGWQGNNSMPYPTWAQPAPAMHIPPPRDANPEQAHIQQPSQYSSGPPPMHLPNAAIPGVPESNKQLPPPPRAFNPALPQHQDVERVKLPPLPQQGLPTTANTQINPIHRPDIRQHLQQDSRISTPVGSTMHRATVSPTPTMSAPVDGSQFTRADVMKLPGGIPHDAAIVSETPMVSVGSVNYTAPNMYRSPSAQQTMPNQQPAAKLPAFPYYQQMPGQSPAKHPTSSNESTSDSLPSMRTH